MTQHVEVARVGHVLEVKLNKPKVNAIDHAMSRELGDAFKTLRDDPELRVGHPDRRGRSNLLHGMGLEGARCRRCATR